MGELLRLCTVMVYAGTYYDQPEYCDNEAVYNVDSDTEAVCEAHRRYYE